MTRVRQSEDGMTLIELLIGVVIVSMITAGIVSAMLTALNIFDPTSHRVVETNDSQTIATFLTRDAQAAGGTDPSTGSLDTTHNLGVSMTDDAGCTTAGGTLLLRFKWFDRTPTLAADGEQNVIVHVANYNFVPATNEIVRTTCDSGSTPVPPSSAVLGSPSQIPLATTVQGVTATCDGVSSSCPSFPDTVALTVTATNQSGPSNPATSPYTYTVSASLRPEGETPPCDKTTPGCTNPTGTINPLIALGLCTGGGSDLDVGGSAQVDVNGGITGSSSCPAMHVHLSSGGSLQSGAVTYSTNTIDPFAGLIPPPDTCSTSTSNPLTYTVGTTIHYRPGTYKTDPGINGNASQAFVFDPGNYVFCAGVSITGSNTNVSGTDVLFYIKGGTASLNGGIVNLTGRTSQQSTDPDNYTGLLIWQDAADTATPMVIAGGTSLNLNGIIYAPSIEVQLRGNSNTFFVKAVIAGAVSFTGTTGITIGTPPPQMSITAPTSLPSWTVGVPYQSTDVAVNGGSGGYTWTVTGLPDGLSFNASTLKITGTPTTPKLYSPQIKVVDSDGDVATVTFSLTISAAPSITGPATLPNADFGRSYPPPSTTAIMTETGGTYPFTWSATGLPTGIAIDGSGSISGTPSVTGTFTPTITLTDNVGATATKTYSMTINALPVISLPSGSSLPPWTSGQPGYSQPITVSGGTGPYVWQLSGAPSGLTISNAGVISGTPSGPQDYAIVVTVTDAVGAAASKSYSLTINTALTITGTVPNGEINVAYSATLNANPGTPPFAWTLTGALPPGLVLTSGPTTATISGSPTATGTYPVTLKLTDSTGASTNQTYSIVINPPPSINPTTLPSWTIGQDYGNSRTTMSGSGGLTPYSWTAMGLPPGLSIGASSGSITGSPSAVGTYSGTITLTDAAGIEATQTFTVTINPAPSISTTTLPDGEVTASYSATTLSATGGTTPFKWTISSGLPPGLTINQNTGVLSGTPTATGSFAITIHATDAAGADASVTITINIYALGTNSLSLTSQSGGGSALVGTRLYYRGSAAGAFTITNNLTTAGTPISSNFAALAGTATGFSFAPGTVSTPPGGPFVSAPFSWTNGTTGGPTETVTGTDSFGGVATTTLTLVNDSTAPGPTIGGTTPSPYTNSTAPAISGTAGTQLADATHSADAGNVTVSIYAGPTATGTPLQTISVATAAGTWSVTPAALAPNAQYTVHVTQSDAVGNIGGATKTFVVDTVAPTVTASMTSGTGSKIIVSGTAGTQPADASDSADASTVEVAICTAANYAGHSNSCSSAWAAYSNPVAVTGGAYTITSSNVGTGTFYATVTQSDGAGNTGTTTTGALTQ